MGSRLRRGRGGGARERGADLFAERDIAGLIEAKQGFLEGRARGFAEAQQLGEIFGEHGAVAGLGVEPDQFGEGGLVERVDGTGALQDNAGLIGNAEQPELPGQQQGIGGPGARLMEESAEHQLGLRVVLEAEEREGAQAVERGGEVRVALVLFARGVVGEGEGGAIVLGGERGLHAGEVDGVEREFPLNGERVQLPGESGLGGVDGEPREEHEGGRIGFEVGQETGEFAGRGGAIVGGVIGADQVDAGTGVRRIAELAQKRVAAGFVDLAELAVEADELEVELVALRKARELGFEPEQGGLGEAALPIALRQENRALEGVAEAPVGDDALGRVVAAAVEVGGGGLQGDELVRENGVGPV